MDSKIKYVLLEGVTAKSKQVKEVKEVKSKEDKVRYL